MQVWSSHFYLPCLWKASLKVFYMIMIISTWIWSSVNATLLSFVCFSLSFWKVIKNYINFMASLDTQKFIFFTTKPFVFLHCFNITGLEQRGLPKSLLFHCDHLKISVVKPFRIYFYIWCRFYFVPDEYSPIKLSTFSLRV